MKSKKPARELVNRWALTYVYSKDSVTGEPRVVSCGPCSRAFYVWLRGWAQRKNKRGLSFYEAAATSIRPPRS